MRRLVHLTVAAITLLLGAAVASVGADKAVLDAETARVGVIAKIRPAVLAVCQYGGTGNGSGVIIDPEGYALTNYHVTDGLSPVMHSGMADGQLYETVIVGQDKIGDVSLIKLLPKEPGKPFPYVKLGDSDKTKAGDWSFAMGNPFSLAMDFTPTVTYGLVSGVNRYQPPAGGGTLEYTDCIQMDTSINPGNSGGPLFNAAGELIGINGRGSFEKRGRVNSGVGYAISINQIKNFLGHFYAGIDTDHATLGATVETASEDGDLSKMIVRQMLEEADVYRRGVQPGDQLIEFAARPLTSTNQYKNILGIFPREWRLPLSYRRGNGARQETLVRLMGNMDSPIEQKPEPKQPGPRPPQRPDPNKEASKKSPAMKLYAEKKGYANYHFNELHQKRVWAAFQKHGDFTKLAGKWTAAGKFDANDRKGNLLVSIGDGAEGQPVAKIKLNVEDEVQPLRADVTPAELQLPQNSGGLISALYQYRRLLTAGPKGFEGGFVHGGSEPFYPPPTDGKPVEDWAKRRIDCDVIRTQHAAVDCKWYFAKTDATLLGVEVFVVKGEDPCEVYFSDYKTAEGGKLPHRLDVVYGNRKYGTLTIDRHAFEAK